MMAVHEGGRIKLTRNIQMLENRQRASRVIHIQDQHTNPSNLKEFQFDYLKIFLKQQNSHDVCNIVFISELQLRQVLIYTSYAPLT